ncbi:TetR/AcrR family transcriptional regulator [Solirubrobacter sp. CPCC 204708]|uniref:TetR/AcrR family transcriptional regulator n=1 Tax=Solirubrobacter deserti TaxID=2282478 RepID=A0ABT4RQ52_9ACTN|nr:helix-turn-helix domain-containing protein [Solirubrobacter deserti]MBE2320631.1 TetR/AcrR family transcriptional regulator [Solirubrobacter deserti]MDA0140685.1 TetR/AcrR family transcriptional regulator [Solirubrobacter deserti]
MAGVNPRQRLLDAVIDHIAQRGVSDLSLRELAAAIGSSHRMLIHHFGGREGLLVAVVQEVEARQRALLDTVVPPDPAASPGDAMRAWWKHISHQALWANERLFFELYGQALQGRPGTTALLDGIIDGWLEPAASIFRQLGFRDSDAAARLGIAVTRGLLLDLLATREVERVDAAMDVHIAALEALMTLQAGRALG